MQKPGSIYGRLRDVPTLSIILLVILAILLFAEFSHASLADSITPEDHNHHRILELKSEAYGKNGHKYALEIDDYEPEFLGSDRAIIGRVDPPVELTNNSPGKRSIESGAKDFWKFSQSEIRSRSVEASTGRASLVERDDEGPQSSTNTLLNRDSRPLQARSTTLYISLAICDQPQPKNANPNEPPAPLQLYISTDRSNPTPDKDHHNHNVSVEFGYGSLELPLSPAMEDIYIGITAPVKSPQFEGSYNYQLTGSLDDFFTGYNSGSEGMVLLDSDMKAALLSSKDKRNTPLYSIFVHPQDDPTILGLSGSFCGLENRALMKGKLGDLPSNDISTFIPKADKDKTRQQFYIQNLNRSSHYYGILAIDGNSNIGKAGSGVQGGGGQLWKALSFTTKPSGNCAIIYNLTFCSDVAYAVPANPENMTDITALAQLYDGDAQTKYQNFDKSIQQVACNTTPTAQYSLARTCDDCTKDYKTWLCAVTIPRCQYFSSTGDHLMPRAVSTTYANGSISPLLEAISSENRSALYMNSSRNPMIDEKIHPGPYKELLPCEDLCYEIVRSCPASLGFACPLKDHGLYFSYWSNGTFEGENTCNYPEVAFYQSRAPTFNWDAWAVSAALLLIMTNLV